LSTVYTSATGPTNLRGSIYTNGRKIRFWNAVPAFILLRMFWEQCSITKIPLVSWNKPAEGGGRNAKNEMEKLLLQWFFQSEQADIINPHRRLNWSALGPMAVFPEGDVAKELPDLWWNDAHNEWSKSNGPPNLIWQGEHLNTSSKNACHS
jgi:hypothetical protein